MLLTGCRTPWATHILPEKGIPPGPNLELWNAVRSNDLSRAEHAVEQGADVNTSTSSGITPLRWFVYSWGNGGPVRLRREHWVWGDWQSVTSRPSSPSIYKMLDLLVREGADIDAKDENGFTALMCAAKTANAKAVEALLVRGADPDVQDNSGMTALHWAAWQTPQDYAAVRKTAKALLKYGADPALKDAEGKTPLDQARRRRRRHPMIPLLQPYLAGE
jgi:ankyrin repeat protein